MSSNSLPLCTLGIIKFLGILPKGLWCWAPDITPEGLRGPRCAITQQALFSPFLNPGGATPSRGRKGTSRRSGGCYLAQSALHSAEALLPGTSRNSRTREAYSFAWEEKSPGFPEVTSPGNATFCGPGLTFQLLTSPGALQADAAPPLQPRPG